MTEDKSRIAAVLRINYWNDGKGYSLAGSVGGDDYEKFEDLACALADYLSLDVVVGFTPEPYRLRIGNRARRKLGDKAVSVLEHMIKQYNMIVRARRELGVEDD